jgi:hypothetical protein
MRSAMNPKHSTFSYATFERSERRSRIRFPIALGVSYSISGRQEVEGRGQTVNISSGGVMIATTHKLSPGASVKVVIDWPILIGNTCPLALHARGRVVRSIDGLVAVQFSTHEFRTRFIPPNHAQGPGESEGMAIQLRVPAPKEDEARGASRRSTDDCFQLVFTENQKNALLAGTSDEMLVKPRQARGTRGYPKSR